jgi:hypothetical protein
MYPMIERRRGPMKKTAAPKSDIGSMFFVAFILVFGLVWVVYRIAGGKALHPRDLYSFKYTYK